MQALLTKYKVKIRDSNEVVEHKTYSTKTILTPEQFAIYEAALKAVYVANQCWFKDNEMWAEFHGCLCYHDQLAAPNDIILPLIEDSWTFDKEGASAAKDYARLSRKLMSFFGVDADTGKKRNLYTACLD